MKTSPHPILTLGCAALVAAPLFFAPDADAAPSPRSRSIGYSFDLGAVQAPTNMSVPAADQQAPLVGIAIAGSNDHVYAWYADGTVSSGTSTNLEYHSARTSFSLPDGYGAWDIIAMAIRGSDDRVITYYANGKFSQGWSQDLDAFSGPQDYDLANGYEPSDVVGIGIAGSNDRVYAWYSDGKFSQGTLSDLASVDGPDDYVVPASRKIGHIIDIGIAGSNDRVYTWYHDVELGQGHVAIADEIDSAAMDLLRRYRLPALGVSVSKNGRVVLEKGYGYSNTSTHERMQPNHRCRIGSVSKVITSLAAMHLDEHSSFNVSDPVYGPNGALGNDFAFVQYIGRTRFTPIISKAIAANDHVFTWNQSGTVSEGTSTNPTAYSGPQNFFLPSGVTIEDIVGMAIAPNNRVYTFYSDRTYSVGTPTDLDATFPRAGNGKFSLPSGYATNHIVGMDFAPNARLYVWYDDGKQSAGSQVDFDSDIAPRNYSSANNMTRFSIRAMGIAKSTSRVYTWYANGTVFSGVSTDLDHYTGPTNYTTPANAADPMKNWQTWFADMQVDHLMSHSSGLDGSGDAEGAARIFGVDVDDLTYDQAHAYHLLSKKLHFAPGTSQSYANHGPGLVGRIIERVSGQSYENYVMANIMNPLGLDASTIAVSQESGDMWRHEYAGNGELVPFVYDSVTTGLGAGGWKVSTGDLVRLMLATDSNPNHPDVLSPAGNATMETRPHPGSDYAHGWAKSDTGDKLAHNGALGGGITYMAKYMPNHPKTNGSQITIAVCANVSVSDARDGDVLLYRLAEKVADVVGSTGISSGYDLY